MGIVLDIAYCFEFVRNTPGNLDLLPLSHAGEKVLCQVLTFASLNLMMEMDPVIRTLSLKKLKAIDSF